MSIRLIFPDGPMEFKTAADAKRKIRERLHVSRATAFRYLQDGLFDFSKFHGTRKIPRVFSVLFPDEETRTVSCQEVIEWLKNTGYSISKNTHNRIWRRLNKAGSNTVSIQYLVSEPLSPAAAGKMGSDVTTRKAFVFSGVEGYDYPVTASQLHKDWNVKLHRKVLFDRLKGGLRTRRELLQLRWERAVIGRPRTNFRPTNKTERASRAKEWNLAEAEKPIKPVQPKIEITAEELAAFNQSVGDLKSPTPSPTKELPPMRTYTPPKPGYRRGC